MRLRGACSLGIWCNEGFGVLCGSYLGNLRDGMCDIYPQQSESNDRQRVVPASPRPNEAVCDRVAVACLSRTPKDFKPSTNEASPQKYACRVRSPTMLPLLSSPDNRKPLEHLALISTPEQACYRP